MITHKFTSIHDISYSGSLEDITKYIANNWGVAEFQVRYENHDVLLTNKLGVIFSCIGEIIEL